MRSCVIMKKNKEYDVYTFKGEGDKRFFVIIQLLSDDFRSEQLLNWLYNEREASIGNEWASIEKEDDTITLYDVSAWMDETYDGEYLDSEKRFEMTVKNFAEILMQWEQLRASRPNIILIVIHEDNHVSLETDPVIIKQYQDAGYGLKKSIFAD